MGRQTYLHTFIPCNLLLTLPFFFSFLFLRAHFNAVIDVVFVVIVTFLKWFDEKHVKKGRLKVAKDCVMKGGHGVKKNQEEADSCRQVNGKILI